MSEALTPPAPHPRGCDWQQAEHVGYWADAAQSLLGSLRSPRPAPNQTLPWPEAGSWTADEDTRRAFLADLALVESEALAARYVRVTKGVSLCRLCGRPNGNKDYLLVVDPTRRYLWPSGYLHYLTEHGVAPDPAWAEDVRLRALLPDTSVPLPVDPPAVQFGQQSTGPDRAKKPTS